MGGNTLIGEVMSGLTVVEFKARQAGYGRKHYAENKERRAPQSAAHNAGRMFVNGKYIPKSHALWKTGTYRSFNDAAFSSFPNYNKTTKGAVYVITNDAWDGWVKVGKAGDAEDRLKGYQTGDPHRSYMLKHYVTVDNRHTGEVKAHKALEALSEARQNEWFKVDLTTAIGCIEALNE
jgi:hypothetical protein